MFQRLILAIFRDILMSTATYCDCSPKMYISLHCVVMLVGGSCLVRGYIFLFLLVSRCGHVTSSCQWNVNRVMGNTSRREIFSKWVCLFHQLFPNLQARWWKLRKPYGSVTACKKIWVLESTFGAKLPNYLPTPAIRINLLLCQVTEILSLLVTETISILIDGYIFYNSIFFLRV